MHRLQDILPMVPQTLIPRLFRYVSDLPPLQRDALPQTHQQGPVLPQVPGVVSEAEPSSGDLLCNLMSQGEVPALYRGHDGPLPVVVPELELALVQESANNDPG